MASQLIHYKASHHNGTQFSCLGAEWDRYLASPPSPKHVADGYKPEHAPRDGSVPQPRTTTDVSKVTCPKCAALIIGILRGKFYD